MPIVEQRMINKLNISGEQVYCIAKPNWYYLRCFKKKEIPLLLLNNVNLVVFYDPRRCKRCKKISEISLLKIS